MSKTKSVKLKRIWVADRAGRKKHEFFEVAESKNITDPLPGDRLQKAELERLVHRNTVNVTIVNGKKS